jgi:cell division protein FtsL
MTFIQPHRQFRLQDALLVFMVILMIGATVALIAVYNGVVNADHNLASLKAKLDQTGAANTNLQNQIIATLGSDAMAQTVASQGLIEEKHPQYQAVNGGSQSLTLR